MLCARLATATKNYLKHLLFYSVICLTFCFIARTVPSTSRVEFSLSFFFFYASIYYNSDRRETLYTYNVTQRDAPRSMGRDANRPIKHTSAPRCSSSRRNALKIDSEANTQRGPFLLLLLLHPSPFSLLASLQMCNGKRLSPVAIGGEMLTSPCIRVRRFLTS